MVLLEIVPVRGPGGGAQTCRRGLHCRGLKTDESVVSVVVVALWYGQD